MLLASAKRLKLRIQIDQFFKYLMVQTPVIDNIPRSL